MCALHNTNHKLFSNLSYTGAHHHIAQEILYCVCMGKHIINTELGNNSQPADSSAEAGRCVCTGAACASAAAPRVGGGSYPAPPAQLRAGAFLHETHFCSTFHTCLLKSKGRKGFILRNRCAGFQALLHCLHPHVSNLRSLSTCVAVEPQGSFSRAPLFFPAHTHAAHLCPFRAANGREAAWSCSTALPTRLLVHHGPVLVLPFPARL